jgi:hypothetical protein
MMEQSNGGNGGRDQIVETVVVDYDGTISPEAHFDRFGQALQRAVDRAVDEWGEGPHAANVQFAVRFKRVNPGQIGEYRVVLG